VRAQTHPDWTVYLVGDRYEDEDEFRSQARLLPPDRVRAVNLPVALERDDPALREIAFWCCAGTNALNTALALQRRDGLVVTAHLDDDDHWRPDHLAVLASTYRADPEAAFVYTRAAHGNGGVLPADGGETGTCARPPAPFRLAHSAASWRLDRIPLSYTSCPAEFGQAVPSDAYMWAKVADYCRARGLRSVFVPETTVVHPSEGSSIGANLAVRASAGSATA
jgi:hypothetical protein